MRFWNKAAIYVSEIRSALAAVLPAASLMADSICFILLHRSNSSFRSLRATVHGSEHTSRLVFYKSLTPPGHPAR
jgi:hypothetical protein